MCAASLLLTPCSAVQEVKASGLKPDTALLNALIRALGSGGLAQEAQGVFRTMVRCPYCKCLHLAIQCHVNAPMIPVGESGLRAPLESELSAMAV